MDQLDAVHVCPRCGSDNRCGIGKGTPCWCATAFEPGSVLDPTVRVCYCARCLQELRDARRTTAGTT